MTDRTDQDKAQTRRELAEGFARMGSSAYSVHYVDAAEVREDAELGIDDTKVGWQVQRQKADRSGWYRPIKTGVRKYATIERIIQRDCDALCAKSGAGMVATVTMSDESSERVDREAARS